MLHGMTWASPPNLMMPSATASQASALRLEITTLAPSLASSSAEERPMPRLEPVMTATLPVRSNGVFFIFFSLKFSAPSFRDTRLRVDPESRGYKHLEIPRCAIAHLSEVRASHAPE